MEVRLRDKTYSIIHGGAATHTHSPDADTAPVYAVDVMRVARQYDVQKWIYTNVIPRRTLADREKRNRSLPSLSPKNTTS